MPDLLAGTEIMALDAPPPDYDFEDTLQTDISSTSYTAPTNACSVTFTAPTSGRVKIVAGGGFRDNSNNNQGSLGVEVRETDVSGTVVETPSAYGRGITSMGEASDYYFHGRITILENLTPGQVYFARIMIKAQTTTSSSVDLRNKNLAVIPVP